MKIHDHPHQWTIELTIEQEINQTSYLGRFHVTFPKNNTGLIGPEGQSLCQNGHVWKGGKEINFTKLSTRIQNIMLEKALSFATEEKNRINNN